MNRQWKQDEARILEEISKVHGEIAILREEERSEDPATGDNTPHSELLDAAQARIARELRMEMMGRLLVRAAALEEALRRITLENYGRCTACGHEIPRRRLRRLPEAALCLLCQERLESRHTAA